MIGKVPGMNRDLLFAPASFILMIAPLGRVSPALTVYPWRLFIRLLKNPPSGFPRPSRLASLAPQDEENH